MHEYGRLTYPMTEFKMNKVSFDVVPSSSLSYEIVYGINGNEKELAYVMA